jgi:hypothetical protein
VRAELVERVQFEELYPRALEQLPARDDAEDISQRAARPRVAVADRVLDQPPFAVNQPVIHRPAVNARAPHRAPQPPRALARLPQPRLDLAEDVRERPAQVPALLARRVLEPPHLFEQQLALGHARHEDAPAPRAEVNRDVKRIVHEKAVGSRQMAVGSRSALRTLKA